MNCSSDCDREIDISLACIILAIGNYKDFYLTIA